MKTLIGDDLVLKNKLFVRNLCVNLIYANAITENDGQFYLGEINYKKR